MKKVFLLFFCALSTLFSSCTTSGKSPKLHICTMASHETRNLDQLFDSCEAHNLSVEVLGIGEPFSWALRLKKYKEFLKGLPENDVAMFVDAYDILILADERTILERFKGMNAPIVFSTEVHCHPFFHLGQYYPPSPTKFKYLNAGSYIGYVKDLKKMFEAISPIPEETDDQGLFSVYFLYNPGVFKLDYHNELFISLLEVTEEEIEMDQSAKSIRYVGTNSSPCVVHGNSSGKQLYQTIYNKVFRSAN